MGFVAQEVLEVADEPVDVPLARGLVDDVLVVVVAQAPRELLVVHLRLILTHAPASSNLNRIRIRIGRLVSLFLIGN